MFPASTYISRRNLLKRRLGHGIVLLPGNGESGMNTCSNCYPFRQDSTFLYYIGIDRPDLAAVIDVDSGDDMLFGDDRTLNETVWTGPQPGLAELAAASGITQVRPASALADCIAQALAAGREVYYTPPYRAEHALLLKELGLAPQGRTDAADIRFRRAIMEQRLIKSDEELVCMEKAAEVSCRMHEAALCEARPGMKEYEVAALMEAEAYRAGCTLSFPTICTVHGEVLHNSIHTNTLQPGQLLLLDAGAETPEHYAGDISTTLPVSRRFDTRQIIIYRITSRMHDAAVAALRPGTIYRDVYLETAAVMVEGLQEAGLMRGGQAAEAVERGAHMLFFPHGIGHALGLDVHDMENLGEPLSDDAARQEFPRYRRLVRPLEPGCVVTVEPGIYFIPDLIARWEAEKKAADLICYDEVRKFIGFGGIRNEEDYVVTAAGKRRLGPAKPRTVETVEACR